MHVGRLALRVPPRALHRDRARPHRPPAPCAEARLVQRRVPPPAPRA